MCGSSYFPGREPLIPGEIQMGRKTDQISACPGKAAHY